MRFLITHHKEVIQLLERQNRAKEEFDFVKKRGRINIIERSSKKFFAYLRVKETQLDPETKQWVETSYFKVKTEEQKEHTVDNWTNVFKEMETWLKGLR